MKSFLQLITVFFVCTFLSSCQKYLGPPDSFSYDADAQKFIDSSGISDNTQKVSLNNFVKQLKDFSLWTKFAAIYPMVGGTANTTRWNLKDPRNLNIAYRLTFKGTPVYAGTGGYFQQFQIM
ncbi:MAG: hypothetical protein ABI834_05630 [Ginsengibacter sp.]